MAYYSTKTYDHNEGLSCAFRQWRAEDSHCRFIHGYAIAVSLTFGCKELEHIHFSKKKWNLKNLD